MNAPPQTKAISVSEATLADVPSLTTIVPRAFHKTNAFHREAVPDTPKVRKWYTRVFSDEIQDERCHVLTILNPSVNTSDERVLGVLLLRQMSPADMDSSGIWTKHDITPDHDKEKFYAMVEPMASARADLMGDRMHFLIELFAVDDDAKGKGLGKELLRHACTISDQEGIDIFVEANMYASAFYQKFGFKVKSKITLPGEHNYGEEMLVYTSNRQAV